MEKPKEEIAYHGKLFAIVKKPLEINGEIKTLEVARRAPGIRLIIETDDGKIAMNKEYRHELAGYDLRLPGGKVFDSLDEYLAALEAGGDFAEHIAAAARKEGKEEVGIDSGDFRWVAKSIAGLTIEWDLHYFVVTHPKIGEQQLEHDENIEVVYLTKEEAEKACFDGSMREDRAAMQLLKYLHGVYSV